MEEIIRPGRRRGRQSRVKLDDCHNTRVVCGKMEVVGKCFRRESNTSEWTGGRGMGGVIFQRQLPGVRSGWVGRGRRRRRSEPWEVGRAIPSQ